MKNTFCLPRGVYTALMTPMTAKGQIDIDATHHLIRCQLKNGITGFYLLGSTGHGFLYSKEMRKKFAETVIKDVKGRCTIIVHVGHMNPHVAAELATHAESCGANAVSSVPSIYYNPDISGILLY